MPPEDTRAVILSMRDCLRHMDDMELIDYIKESGDEIVEYLTNYAE
jgi:hypothetical protein